MAFYLCGVLEGISRGREQAESEMARLWHHAFNAVQRQAKCSPHIDLEEHRRQHQLEALQANLAAARRWPPEDPNPSTRVLNGWPDLPKRVTT